MLDEQFISKFLTFNNGEFFDQVSAARMLLGLTRTFNEYIKEQAESVFIDINVTKQNLNLSLNCKQADARHMKTNSISADNFEMGIGQNAISSAYPQGQLDL